MPRNNDYTTGNLLDYLYHQQYFKVAGIHLSRQANMNICQQSSFVGKLEDDDDATMFFCLWKAAKSYSKLFFRFVNCNRVI